MPLLGAIGNASEYSFRGTYDNYPFDIDFGDLIDAEPGQIYTTSLKLIEDINYKVPISISGDGEYYIIGNVTFDKTFDNDYITFDQTATTFDAYKVPISIFGNGEYYIGNVTFDKTFDNDYITFDQIATTFDATFPAELDYSTQQTYVRNGNTIGLRIFGVPPKILNDNITVVDRSLSEYSISLSGNLTIGLRSGDYTFTPNNLIQIDDRTFQGDEVGTEYYDKTYSTTITIGKRDFTWTVKTKAAESAQNLSFTNQTDVDYSSEIISDTYTAQGLTDSFEYTADITSNEGLLSVNYGEFLQSSPIKNGDILRLKLTSSSLNATQKNAAVRIALTADSTVGSISTTWSLTTLDSIPSNLSFTDVPSAELNAQILSDIITIDGLSDGIDFNVSVTSTDGLLSINSSTFLDFQFQVDDGTESTILGYDIVQYEFKPGIVYSLICNKNITVDIKLIGGGGGGSSGGAGGYAEGTFTFIKDQTYKLVVGTAGSKDGTSDISGGGASAGTGGNSGGGYTGLFVNSISHDNAIIIAGGGGGAAENDYRPGGYGGGLEGQSTSAGGGTQTSGGLGFSFDSENGSELKGGDSKHLVENGGGGGGGGYWGGGGARGDDNFSPGPYGGGGGSGYINQNLIQNGIFKVNLDQYGISGGKNNNKENGTFLISFDSFDTSTFVKSATIKNGDELQLRVDTSSLWLEEKNIVVKLENTSTTWKVRNRAIIVNSDTNADKLIVALPYEEYYGESDATNLVRLKSGVNQTVINNSYLDYSREYDPSISNLNSKYYTSSYKMAKGATTNDVSGGFSYVFRSEIIGRSDFTLEMWVYLTGYDFNGANAFWLYGEANYPDLSTGQGLGVLLTSNFWDTGRGKIALNAINLNQNFASYMGETSSGNLFNISQWNHIAITRSGNLFSIYVNGVNRGSFSYTIDLPRTYFNVGEGIFSRAVNEDIYIQDLRLYKGIAKYTSNFNVSNVTSIMEQYLP